MSNKLPKGRHKENFLRRGINFFRKTFILQGEDGKFFEERLLGRELADKLKNILGWIFAIFIIALGYFILYLVLTQTSPSSGPYVPLIPYRGG